MKIERKYFIILIVFALLLFSLIFLWNNGNLDPLRAKYFSGEYVIGGARGDEVAPGPIEVECLNRMNRFQVKYQTNCKLISSETSEEENKCKRVGGMSITGCAICKIKCK